VIVDDHAAVAVQDLASRRRDRQRFDPVAFGLLVIELRILNLQRPKAGNQKEKNGDRSVLKNGDFAGRELDIFFAGLLRR